MFFALQNTTADTPRGDDHGFQSDLGGDSTQHDTPANIPWRADQGIELHVRDDSTQHFVHMPELANIKGNPDPGLSMKKTGAVKQLNEIAAAIKELKELNETISNRYVDECEAFGRHIAAQLKKLHPKHCILAQEDMQRVLTKYRLAELSNHNAEPTLPPSSVFLDQSSTRSSSRSDSSTGSSSPTDSSTRSAFSDAFIE